MLNIYIADLTGLKDSYDEKWNILHRSRAEKLASYKIFADKVRSLGAGLLLEKGLVDYLQLRNAAQEAKFQDDAFLENISVLPKDADGRYVIDYAYGPQGKPYFKDYPGICFNLSHSGNLVVLALADTEVGIDVQEHRGYNEKIARRFYHEKEIKMLEAVSDPIEREKLFYRIWTCKEGYIKYTGKGMGQELRNFYWDRCDNTVCIEGQKVAGVSEVPLDSPGYFCSVVSGNIITKMDKIIKILI